MESSTAETLLEAWLDEIVAAPGLTAIRDPATARAMLLDDALRATALVAAETGPVIDVGSGGGTPGIPLAASLPAREVTLLEADGRKCAFLSGWAARLPNLVVVHGRAEEQPLEQHGVALAKALAQPATAVEWCLPLVREGGAALLWLGPSADLGVVARVATVLAGHLEGVHDGIAVIRKLGPTPERFPRRPGMAKKRPLG